MVIVEVSGEVQVVSRQSLYGANHKFKMYYEEGLHNIPFNVWCEPCQSMCAIDTVQKPGFIKFWCPREFDAYAGQKHSKGTFMQRCSFSLTFSITK